MQWYLTWLLYKFTHPWKVDVFHFEGLLRTWAASLWGIQITVTNHLRLSMRGKGASSRTRKWVSSIELEKWRCFLRQTQDLFQEEQREVLLLSWHVFRQAVRGSWSLHFLEKWLLRLASSYTKDASLVAVLHGNHSHFEKTQSYIRHTFFKFLLSFRTLFENKIQGSWLAMTLRKRDRKYANFRQHEALGAFLS